MVRVPNDFGIIPRPFPDSEHEAYWKDWKESKEHEIKSRPDNPRQASRFAQTIPDDRFRLVIWVGKDFKFGDAPGLRIEVKPSTLPKQYLVDCSAQHIKGERGYFIQSRELRVQVAHKDLDYVRIVPHGRDKYPRLFEARIRVSIHRAKLDESVSGGFRTSGMPYVLEYTFKSFKCLTNLGYLPKALTRKKQESKTETTDRAPPKDTERTATAISATSSNSSPYVEANSARPLAAVVERVKKFDFGSALALGPTDCLRDQGFVVTGGFGGSCSVNDIMILIRTHGGYTLDQPCKLTQYLVAGDNPSATEAQAAESFGMKTITQQDLFEGIGNCCAKRSSRESSTEELPRLDQSQSTTEDLTSKAPAIAEKRPAPESPAAPAPTSKRRRLEDTEGCFRLSSTRTHSDNSSRPTKRTTRAGSTNPHLTPPNSESPLQDISKPVPTARSKVVVLPVGGRTKNKTSRLQTQQVQEIVNRPVLQPLKTETGSEVIDLTEKDDESPERNSEARHGSSPLAVEHAAGEPDTSRERASESPESTGQAGTSVYFSEIEELQKKHLLTLRRVDNLEFKLAAAVADDPDEEELELQRVELKLKIKKMQRAKGRAGTELK